MNFCDFPFSVNPDVGGGWLVPKLGVALVEGKLSCREEDCSGWAEVGFGLGNGWKRFLWN